jgi:hypothetical protein
MMVKEFNRRMTAIIGLVCVTIALLSAACGGGGATSLDGKGNTTANASLSPADISISSQAVGTASSPQSVTLSNSGDGDLSITSLAFDGTNPADFAQTNDCGQSVAAGASCTIKVVFKPIAAGSRSAGLTLNNDSSSRVTIKGTGIAPAVSLSPTSLTFASEALNVAAAVQKITVTNSGTATLKKTGIAVSGADASDFTETDTCGATLAANASCSISVSFKPSVAGTRTAAVTLTDNAPNSPQTAALRGTIATTTATASPTSLSFSSQSVNTASAAKTITLTNTGSGDLNVTTVSLLGADASDFAQTNTCGSTLAPGATCAVNVTFKPTAGGTRTASVSIADTATGSPQTVTLTGTGAAAAASVSPTSVAYGNQSVSVNSGAKSVTLSNTGNAPLNVGSISFSGANAGDFAQINTCGNSVAASSSCAIKVTFKPSVKGTRTATLMISDSASTDPETVTLSGMGTAAAINVSSSSIVFGNQSLEKPSTAQSVTISNPGNAALTISGISITGSNSGDFDQTNNCGSSVGAGSGCVVNVMFTPSASGTRSAVVSIADSVSPQTVNLTGTGAAAGISVSPSSIAFGSQSLNHTAAAAHSITLSNSGNAALTISGISITGSNAGDFDETNTCGSSVAAGGSCTISVNFTPSASGTRSAAIAIADSVSPQTVSLTGTGAAAGISVAPSSLSFGSQAIGSASAAQAVTLRNTGNAALTVSGITISGTSVNDFAQTNNCGSSVAAGASCTINVTFTPTASGSRSASISIADSVSPQSVSLTGTGAAAGISVSPSSLTFGNQAIGNASASQPVTLRNTGNAALTISGITISGVSGNDFAQTNNCGSSVAAGASCTINVAFTPTASGSRSASISIADSISPQSVSLAGTGASAAGSVSLSASGLTFSSASIGVSSPAETVTVTNTGGSAVNISGVSITGSNASDFAQNNTCAGSLASGSNCTIVLLFTPSAVGQRTATLDVADDASGSPQTVSLTGSGGHNVVLTWTASPSGGIIGYNVYRGTRSGGETTTPMNSTPINGTDFTDENVNAGAEYFYVVTSVTSDGTTESAPSTETNATVPTP